MSWPTHCYDPGPRRARPAPGTAPGPGTGPGGWGRSCQRTLTEAPSTRPGTRGVSAAVAVPARGQTPPVLQVHHPFPRRLYSIHTRLSGISRPCHHKPAYLRAPDNIPGVPAYPDPPHAQANIPRAPRDPVTVSRPLGVTLTLLYSAAFSLCSLIDVYPTSLHHHAP